MAGFHDAKNYIVTVGGVRIEGFADGDFISFQEPEAFTTVQGSDGLVTRSATNNTVTDITLTLLAASPSNDVLDALYTVDVNAPNGSGVFALAISDLFGRFEAVAPEAWIKQKPEVAIGREEGSRAWVISCSKMTSKINGSA